MRDHYFWETGYSLKQNQLLFKTSPLCGFSTLLSVEEDMDFWIMDISRDIELLRECSIRTAFAILFLEPPGSYVIYIMQLLRKNWGKCQTLPLPRSPCMCPLFLLSSLESPSEKKKEGRRMRKSSSSAEGENDVNVVLP